jgi:alanine-alpha-ketoisovalerate/valine-pyruvate aminotransferase
LEESELAGNVIKSLDSNKWSSIVEKELMSNGKWLTYGEMKSKQFYPFLVQSSIDLISNKLVEYRYMLENPEVEMKFDEN